jgi:hypothetical protein
MFKINYSILKQLSLAIGWLGGVGGGGGKILKLSKTEPFIQVSILKSTLKSESTIFSNFFTFSYIKIPCQCK